MIKFIPYGKQSITKDDITSVSKSLRYNLLTTGPGVQLFENEFSRIIKSKYSVASNSGTSAIALALFAINLKKNDIVIMPSINFVAAANLTKNLGAKVFFSDVDSVTGQMTTENLINCIKINKIKKIKVFFTMHNAGFSNYSKEFFKIKKKHKCILIEDACHGLGGKNSLDNNDYIGNCKYSDFSIFSLHPLKSITTGEGGISTTNNKKYYTSMLKYRNHGFNLKRPKKNFYNWKHNLQFCGYNFRLTDVQSYLGLSQLKKLEKFIKRRNFLRDLYFKKLSHLLDYVILPNKNKYYSACHLFILIFRINKLKINRDKIIQLLYKKKIFTQVHYIPIYRQKPFKVRNFKNFIGAEKYYSSCLSLPIFPNLTTKEVAYVANNIEAIINKFKK